MIDEHPLISDTQTLSIRKARALVAALPAKLEERKKALANEEQRYREAEALLLKHEKAEQRRKRTHLVSHAGGMMEMAGLLEYRFIGSTERDNPQDDLRANLLVGALLSLAHHLSTAPSSELEQLTANGKAYRTTKPSARQIPKVNPLVLLAEIHGEES